MGRRTAGRRRDSGAAERSTAGAAPPVPELPQRPAWDLVDIERYRSVWLEAHGYFSLNMAASRGCSFRCNWCAKPIWGNQYLQRKPGDIAAEMLHLKGRYAPDHVWFADDIFGFRADWVMEFAAALAAGGGGVPFTIQLRADLVSPRMADALRERGAAKCGSAPRGAARRFSTPWTREFASAKSSPPAACSVPRAFASDSSCSSVISAKSSRTFSRPAISSTTRARTT